MDQQVVLTDPQFEALLEDATAGPTSFTDKLGNALVTTIVFAGMAGAVTAGSWGWATANDWLDNRRQNRRTLKSAK